MFITGVCVMFLIKQPCYKCTSFDSLDQTLQHARAKDEGILLHRKPRNARFLSGTLNSFAVKAPYYSLTLSPWRQLC